MGYGYTFDDKMRKKLVKAVKKYEESNGTNRSDLNSIIMEIQQPVIDVLNKVRELVV